MAPEHERRLILFYVLKKRWPERFQNLGDLKLQTYQISSDIQAEIDALLVARAKGLPLQHLTGEQFFFEHEYEVNASTLIPRPETEILVSEIFRSVSENFSQKPFRFAELGLGSGIISAEILAQFPHASGVASELNQGAIELAERNLARVVGAGFKERLQIKRSLHVLQGFEIFLSQKPFDFVVSNPPYLSSNDEIEAEVFMHEPQTALIPEGSNPNFFYDNFIEHTSQILKPGGWFFFEVAHERAVALRDKFTAAGLSHVSLIHDLTNRPRVLKGRMPKS